jgi:uncharacterized membrane protein
MTNRKTNTLVWLVIALVISVATMAVIGAFAFSGTDNGYGMMGGGDWGWGMAFMVVPAIILVLILVVAFGGFEERPKYNTYPSYVPPQQSPLDILNQRYAQGGISHDDYERIRAKLERS